MLTALAPAMPGHASPDASLILSGLLTDQAPEVAAAYQAHGFRLVESRDEDEWTALLLTLAAPSGRLEAATMRRLFVPAEKWIASARHRRGRAAPPPGARAARAARRQGDAVRRARRRGRRRGAVRRARPDHAVAGRATPGRRAARDRAWCCCRAWRAARRWTSSSRRPPSSACTRSCPIAAGRSVARVPAGEAAPRRARWEKIAQEAARQCGRADVPAIASPRSLAEAVARRRTTTADHLRLALWEGSRGQPAARGARGIARPRRSACSSAPKADSPTRRSPRPAQAGFEVVGLGPRILRVETAAVVAVALVQAATGALD